MNVAYKSYSDLLVPPALHLAHDKKGIVRGALSYVANKCVWNRILTGELTLEAITIGGCGSVYKPELNISHHHHFISKQAYIIQNKIKKFGLDFFRAQVN